MKVDEKTFVCFDWEIEESMRGELSAIASSIVGYLKKAGLE